MFAEDFSLFFNDFDTTVLINDVETVCIYSNEFVNADGVATSAPHIYIPSTKIEELDIQRETEVLINKDVYEVASIENDGTGLSIIFLEKRWSN